MIEATLKKLDLSPSSQEVQQEKIGLVKEPQ